jgi:CRP/FNR family cyclic AMP-dependent transcriptional regulator
VPLRRSDPKVEALKSVPLFATLPKKHLEQLARRVDELELPAGKVLCEEGTTGGEAFVILEGDVEIVKGSRRVTMRGAGDIVGEIALVLDVPRIATVTALTPLRVFVLSRSAFKAVLDDEPDVARAVLETVAQRLFATLGDRAI